MAPSPTSGSWPGGHVSFHLHSGRLASGTRGSNTRSLCLQSWAWEADSAAWPAHPAAPLGGHLQPTDLGWTVGSSHQEGLSGSPLPAANGRVGSGQDAPPGRDGLTPAQVAGPHYWVTGPAIPHQSRARHEVTQASEAQTASTPALLRPVPGLFRCPLH